MPRNPQVNTILSMVAAKKNDNVAKVRAALTGLTGLTADTDEVIAKAKEQARSTKFVLYGELFSVGALIPNDDKRGEAIDALMDDACKGSNSGLRDKLYKAGKITPQGSKFKKAILLGTAGVNWDDVVSEVDKLKAELPRGNGAGRWNTPEDDRALMVAGEMAKGGFKHAAFVKARKVEIEAKAKLPAKPAKGAKPGEVQTTMPVPANATEKLAAAKALLAEVQAEGFSGVDAVLAGFEGIEPPKAAAPSPVQELGGVADPASFLNALTKEQVGKMLPFLLAKL